tara:strand:- start:5 stop:121 length:117 start_codon:yes stop_codon:yes gene_type:complete
MRRSGRHVTGGIETAADVVVGENMVSRNNLFNCGGENG